ncbi:MAG: tetratricopeptide repeat protein [Bacteroidia bacterium]|nr:tetratricopeptide repeat protein [Bacteroidia bacterium]
MKFSILFLALLLFSFPLFGQDQIDKLIEEGIAYHDQKDYGKAIETYQKALAIDSLHPLANYEICFSYFLKGDYDNCIKHADVVLSTNNRHMLPAYVNKASALDNLGRQEESIELFKEALEKTEGHYLLFYNMGLTYYKMGKKIEAEACMIDAINKNPAHASSHWMLALIHDEQNHRAQTLLATHFFLFLEPNTSRSKVAFKLLKEKMAGGASKKEGESNTFNVSLSDEESEFGSIENSLTMMQATSMMFTDGNMTVEVKGGRKKKKGKKKKEREEESTKLAQEITEALFNEEALFAQNTKVFFELLGENKKDKSETIWWTFYTPLFYDIAQSEHMETYCNYISQSSSEKAANWVQNNPQKLEAFNEWLKSDD